MRLDHTKTRLRKELAMVDEQIEKLEARRVAILEVLRTYEPKWTSPASRTKRASTMQMVRIVLSDLQREATTPEIRFAIHKTFGVTPAPSLAVMLFREGSKNRSGIYRLADATGRGRYGLLHWKNSSGATSNGEDEIPV